MVSCLNGLPPENMHAHFVNVNWRVKPYMKDKYIYLDSWEGLHKMWCSFAEWIVCFTKGFGLIISNKVEKNDPWMKI